MMRFAKAGLTGLWIGMLPFGAMAQQPPSDLPDLPQTAPDLARQVEAPEPAPGVLRVVTAGGGPSFPLTAIMLEGATAIDADMLAPIWADLIGTSVTVATLNAVAAEISAFYRAQGFLLSQAVLPAQTIAGGVVRITVIEGFIDTVTLSGGAENQQTFVRRTFAPVNAERPLRIETLERSVLLSRDTIGSATGRAVETVLGPSPDTFGAADLTVQIAPQPVTGYLSADNRGSRLYGDVTLGAGVRAVNTLGLNETLDANLAFAPEGSALRFGSVTLEAPLPVLVGTRLDGARLRFAANVFRGAPDLTQAGDTTGLVSVSDQTEVSAQLLVPFIRTRSANLFGRVGLTLRDNATQTGLVGLVVQEDERLSVFELGAAWDYADTRGGISFVDISVRQGLGFAGARLSATGAAAGDLHFTSAQLTLSQIGRAVV